MLILQWFSTKASTIVQHIMSQFDPLWRSGRYPSSSISGRQSCGNDTLRHDLQLCMLGLKFNTTDEHRTLFLFTTRVPRRQALESSTKQV